MDPRDAMYINEATGKPNYPMSAWVYVAFGCTGLLIGLVTGLSASPIVKGLLPLLFGLLAGGAGFFAAKRVLFSKSIGIALSSLTIFGVLGLFEGLTIRTNTTWHDIFLHQPAAPVATLGIPIQKVDGKNVRKYVQLARLRSELGGLHLSQAESAQILAAASEADDSTVESLANELQPTVPFSLDHVPSLANNVPRPGDENLIRGGEGGTT